MIALPLSSGAVVAGCGDEPVVGASARSGAGGGGTAGRDAGGGGFTIGGFGASLTDAVSEGASGSDRDAVAGASGAAGAGAGGSSPDADQPDAGDGATSPTDSGPDASLVCGDGIRDPVTEECDDGPGTTPDSCDENCRIRDVLVGPNLPADGLPRPPGRKLGAGPHTVAAGSSGFAIVFVEDELDPVAVKLRSFGMRGEPAATAIDVSGSANAFGDSDPVIAALPSGQYAVAWTNLNGDGDGRGIALRFVDPSSAAPGPLGFANSTRAKGQQRPDIVATDSEIVVAWMDDGKIATHRADLYCRRLSLTGTALTASDEALATTEASEDHVTLGRWGPSWVAGWFVSDSSGQSVRVKAGSASWSIGPLRYGAGGDRMAFAEIDATHLFVAFIAVVPGSGSLPEAPRLHWAVLDTAAPGEVTWMALEPKLEPEPVDQQAEHARPSAVRVGDALYVAWQSRVPATTAEIWLKRIGLTRAQGGVTLDFAAPEIELPRWDEHRAGTQQTPALAATSVPGSPALVAAWEDLARTFGAGAGTPDVIAQLIPAPIVRLAPVAPWIEVGR